MTSSRIKSLGLAALILAASAGVAYADSAVLILDGGPKDGDKKALSASARSAGEGAGWKLENDTGVPAERDMLACLQPSHDAKCAANALAKIKPDYAIVLRVMSENGDDLGTLPKGAPRVIRGWMLRRNGDLVVSDQGRCDGCRPEELRDAARGVTAELLRRTVALTASSALIIKSQPAGAQVFVDGVPIGATDRRYEVFAGKHTVRLELEGFQTEEYHLDVASGEQKNVDVQMKPTGDKRKVARVDGEHPHKSLWPRRALYVAPGAILVVGGGALFALDEDGQRDGQRRQSHRETTVEAWTVTAIGAAALTAGIVMLVLHEKKSDDKPSPTVQIDRGGAVVGISGRF
jgi:hypothetical protein